MKKINLSRVFGLLLAACLFSIAAPVIAEEVKTKYEGLTLNANLEMAAGKDFSDGMVLLLHGFRGHNKMEIISTAQEALLANDSSSLAINLSLGADERRGFYSCDLPHRHLQSDAIGEIGAWVAWLRSKGAKQIVLMAHSRGANQAMVYAVEKLDPEITHLVMLAPGTGGTDETNRDLEERYGISITEVLALMEKRVAQGRGDELTKADLLSCPQVDITPRSYISYVSPNNKFVQFKTYLSSTPIPSLVIAGSADERQPNTAELVRSVVDNERVQLVVIEGAGHFFRDFNIEEAIEAAIEFIQES